MRFHSIGAMVLALSVTAIGARAASFSVLHKFKGTDGDLPQGELAVDGSSSLFGVTSGGGPTHGKGTVFKLASDGTFSTLYTFAGRYDAAAPSGGLVLDASGNLYGPALMGGSGAGCGTPHCGAVFKLTSGGDESLLYSFSGQMDGWRPMAGLAIDGDGNLYGTTFTGGGRSDCLKTRCGTVFKLAPDGSETILHVFAGGNVDGQNPYAPLLRDVAGNLYGTTNRGGGTVCVSPMECGTVFKLSPEGALSVLHAFGGSDGSFPQGGLIADGDGNLYGTTYYGGAGCDYGCGTVFRLSPGGVLTTLHAFTGGNDGKFPIGRLVADADGNLYGTAMAGGDAACHGGYGCGTVYRIAPDGAFRVLHRFDGPRGANPFGGLVADGAGHLYGTTTNGGNTGCGGSGCGTVFRLTP